MEIMEIMKQRHSVRSYTEQPIEHEKRLILDNLIQEINQKAYLHIQMIYDDPKCFDSFMAHYGKFSGVRNYIALIGKKSPKLDEMPEWFLDGMKAAMLAPTAMNQQKFRFELQSDGTVKVSCGTGFYTKLDLGIVTYHFEVVANKKII